MIALELKNGYYWHRLSEKSDWKIVRLVHRFNGWVYFFNNEFSDLYPSDQLQEVSYPD